MKTIAAFVIGLIIFFAMFLGLHLAAFEFAKAMGGLNLTERLHPYANSHYLELAVEGSYSPLKDPIFLFHAFVVNFIPFCLISFVSKKRFNNHFSPLIVITSGLIASYLIHFYLFTATYPKQMFYGYLYELLIAVLAGAIGISLGKEKRFVANKTGEPDA
jgi:hypothetical protein